MADATTLKRGSKELAHHWRVLLQEWARSGLTQAEFCRRRGLSAPALRWWNRRLCGTRRRERPPASSARKTKKGIDDPRRFAELTVVSADRPDGLGSGSQSFGRAGLYEVVLAGGRLVRVGPDFDSQALSRLIAAVEGVASC